MLRLLPRSAEVLTDWDRKSPPTMPMQTALMEDLKAVDDDQALGDMVRRLNSARSGFRTLMSKTTSALDDMANPPADLVSIDKRWEKPEFWLAIADALSPLTDRNLLAAVDLGRNAAGDIEHLPADQSVNRVILVRTFWIAALVTFACACIGFPYAMIAASLDRLEARPDAGCRAATALDLASGTHRRLVHPVAGTRADQRPSAIARPDRCAAAVDLQSHRRHHRHDPCAAAFHGAADLFAC